MYGNFRNVLQNSDSESDGEMSTLYISDNCTLPYEEQSSDMYFNKSTVIFGSSGSGKTTIVKHILYLLRDKIPSCFIIAPTNQSNHTYTGIIPPRFIFSDLNVSFLDRIWERQSDAADLYETICNIKNLKRIFDQIANKAEKDAIKISDKIWSCIT